MEMELSNGGDRVNQQLPNGVILENGIYSDDGGNGDFFLKNPAKIARNEVAEEGQLMIQITNGNSDLLETLDISSNDSNYVDSGDDDHTTTTQSDSLSGGDDDIEKREVVPVKTKVLDDDAVSATPVNDEKSNGHHHHTHAYVHVTTMIMSKLPKPEAPRGITLTDSPRDFERSHSVPESFTNVDMPAIGKFFREKSNSLSAALTKRLSSLTEYNNPTQNDDVSEFNLSGLKVIVKLKNNDDESDKEKDETDPTELKGRITFFSRSRCRDCKAVRSFLRERRLKYVEINVDVFPNREKELISRTGSAAVPQIFFNEKLFGGLVALNSLRNSGTLEGRLKELLWKKCPESAPLPPVYGFDDHDEEEVMDEMVATVRVLRQRLPIQDRLMKMKIVKNCFSGAEMVEVLIQHFDCGRKKVRLTF